MASIRRRSSEFKVARGNEINLTPRHRHRRRNENFLGADSASTTGVIFELRRLGGLRRGEAGEEESEGGSEEFQQGARGWVGMITFVGEGTIDLSRELPSTAGS
jgi:hypothetical protein